MPAHTPADLHKLFRDAANQADLDALLALYEPDPAFASGPGESAAGAAALRAHLAGLIAAGARFDHVTTTKVFEAGDLALTCSDWQASAAGADGGTVTMTGRGTEVARRQPDGSWLLVVDNPWGTA